ncbi:MAG: hypothetical protein J0I06_05775 [Planctomycetes bacterium]|nr:hypothetical protein [Planctomycetota bacterium]
MSEFEPLRRMVEELIREEQLQTRQLERLVARVEQSINRPGPAPGSAAQRPRRTGV